MEVAVNFSSNSGPDIIKALQGFVEDVYKIVGNKFEEVARDAIDEYANDRDYTISVDGKPTLKSARLNHARRRIQIIFPGSSVAELAVAGFKNRLLKHMKAHTPQNDWMNFVKVRAHVSVYYMKKGSRGAVRISPSTKIKNFAIGDVIYVTPDYPTQVYANASMYGGGGFMAKAAKDIQALINRRYGYNRQTSVFRVRAERSGAVWWSNLKKHRNPKRTSSGGKLGTPITMTAPKQEMISAWTIAIRRKDEGRVLRG